MGKDKNFSKLFQKLKGIKKIIQDMKRKYQLQFQNAIKDGRTQKRNRNKREKIISEVNTKLEGHCVLTQPVMH